MARLLLLRVVLAQFLARCLSVRQKVHAKAMEGVTNLRLMDPEYDTASIIGWDGVFRGKFGIDVGGVLNIHYRDLPPGTEWWTDAKYAAPDAMESLSRIIAIFGPENVFIVSRADQRVQGYTNTWFSKLDIFKKTGLLEKNVHLTDFDEKFCGKGQMAKRLELTHIIDDTWTCIESVFDDVCYTVGNAREYIEKQHGLLLFFQRSGNRTELPECPDYLPQNIEPYLKRVTKWKDAISLIEANVGLAPLTDPSIDIGCSREATHEPRSADIQSDDEEKALPNDVSQASRRLEGNWWFYRAGQKSYYNLEVEDNEHIFFREPGHGAEGRLQLRDGWFEGIVKGSKRKGIIRLRQAGNIVSQYKNKAEEEWSEEVIAHQAPRPGLEGSWFHGDGKKRYYYNLRVEDDEHIIFREPGQDEETRLQLRDGWFEGVMVKGGQRKESIRLRQAMGIVSQSRDKTADEWSEEVLAHQACADMDNGTEDSNGKTCVAYRQNPSWCGRYDDSDFMSSRMCCACGGGQASRPGLEGNWSHGDGKESYYTLTVIDFEDIIFREPGRAGECKLRWRDGWFVGCWDKKSWLQMQTTYENDKTTRLRQVWYIVSQFKDETADEWSQEVIAHQASRPGLEGVWSGTGTVDVYYNLTVLDDENIFLRKLIGVRGDPRLRADSKTSKVDDILTLDGRLHLRDGWFHGMITPCHTHSDSFIRMRSKIRTAIGIAGGEMDMIVQLRKKRIIQLRQGHWNIVSQFKDETADDWSEEVIARQATTTIPACDEMCRQGVAQSGVDLFFQERAKCICNWKQLRLSRSDVTDDGLQELLQNCNDVHEIRLTATKVTDAGVKEIARRCPKLQTIFLDSSGIGDASVKELVKRCPTLTELHAANTSTTNAFKKELRRKCKQIKLGGADWSQ